MHRLFCQPLLADRQSVTMADLTTTASNSCDQCGKSQDELQEPLKRCARCGGQKYCSKGSLTPVSSSHFPFLLPGALTLSQLRMPKTRLAQPPQSLRRPQLPDQPAQVRNRAPRPANRRVDGSPRHNPRVLRSASQKRRSSVTP